MGNDLVGLVTQLRATLGKMEVALGAIHNGNAVHVSRVAELPPEAAAEKTMMFQSQFIQSLVDVPMIHSGKVVGVLGSDVVHFSRTWSQEDINLLQLVGELIAIDRAWVAKFQQAALAVDADQILQLIEQLPQTHFALAQRLADLVRRFCFDESLELTQGDGNA